MILAALLALALVQPPPPALPPAIDTAAVIDGAIEAERRFFKRWRDEWKDGELDRRPARLSAPPPRSNRESWVPRPFRGGARDIDAWTPRLAAVHCHAEPTQPGVPVPSTRIASASRGHAWCPGWYRPLDPSLPDESLALDSALAPGRRARIAAARWRLVATLDSAARRLPGNALLAGQRVRFLVDAGAHDSALAVARACAARAAACARFAGYVLARRGDVLAADSAFAAARAAMTDAERCAWDDVSALLDEDGRKAYAALSCAARDSANARLWWLARPLLVDAANERRVEHYARKTYVELHAVGGFDERHDWAPTHGGDALARMYERYGVPSYQFWGGPTHEERHDGYLLQRGAAPSGPYTAPEYRPGRLHLVPAWRVIADPFAARSDDWELSARLPEYPGTWWPAEHYARRAGHLASLPEGQTALLRRAEGALLAVATAPGTRERPETREAVLVVSPHPDSLMLQVARAAPGADGRLVLSGSMGAHPALVGVEIVGEAGAPSARLRFGVTPPPTLLAMRDGETAVSAPVLFAAPDGSAAPPDDPGAVIARMLPSTTVRGVRRVAVYWETYGLAPADTVDVEVRVERADSAGALRRAAAALRLADRPEGGVSVRWREPRPDQVLRVVDAPRPVVARSVVLELSRLPGGRYWVEVSVGRPGAAPARARREMVLD